VSAVPNWGIVGHEQAVDLLGRAIARQRIGHAYLFSGPHGVGKRSLAVAFAQALNCERFGPAAFQNVPGAALGLPLARLREKGAGGMQSGFENALEGLGDPCGQCRRCRLIAADSHPEVRTIGVQAPHRVIRVADIEAIQAESALRASDVFRKLYILEQVELLHPDAANRLLKTIEEPPSSVMMILTTVDPDATMETIVSRCQHVRLRPLLRDRLADILTERSNLEPERAALIAALSEGCFGRGQALATNARFFERREEQLDDLARLLSSDRLARLAYARTLGDRWSRDQDSVRDVLGAWLRWWRDVLLTQTGLGDRIVNLDRRSDIERLARLLPKPDVNVAVAGLRDILQMLDQNVNARLALDVALLDLPRPERAA
jgi:DNA polymerase-3 subunit delta'